MDIIALVKDLVDKIIRALWAMFTKTEEEA